MNELRQRITCEKCGKEIPIREKEKLEACPFCGSRHFHYWTKDNPVPMNFDTKPAQPKKTKAAKRKERTPHQRIMDAHEKGTGIRLTVEEVDYLAMDDAIATRACVDDEAQENDELT